MGSYIFLKRGNHILLRFAAVCSSAAMLLAVVAGPAHSDIIKVCAAEIKAHCADVPSGRGRISACLFAYAPQIEEPCAASVAEVSSSRSVQRFVPRGITELKGSPYEAELRSACSGDASRLCPGVDPSNERVLACLYAREKKLSSSCRKTGERVMRQIK